MTSRFNRNKGGTSSASKHKDEPRGNVNFKTLTQEIVEWEPNNFIEVARKSYTATGDNAGSGEFFALARGYYASGNGDVEEGTPIYQKSITIPATDEVLDSFLDALDKVCS
tara:strand:- start:75 stop:407 length:333 start_codon:yes stop_codon:yes gene_type:complete